MEHKFSDEEVEIFELPEREEMFFLNLSVLGGLLNLDLGSGTAD